MSAKRHAEHALKERPVKRIKLQNNLFDMLPDELLSHIMAFSPVLNVCSRWRNVTRSAQFWRSACLTRWGDHLPITMMNDNTWTNDKAPFYVFPSCGDKPDWKSYYSLRSFFCPIVQKINNWKEMKRDMLLQDTELSTSNFHQFFNYIHYFKPMTKFLLTLLPILIVSKKLGLLSRTASYFSRFDYFTEADPTLIRQLWKIMLENENPDLQFEFFKSTCRQFCLLREYDEEMKQIFKNLVFQMIQYGFEEEHQPNTYVLRIGWIYPTRELIIRSLLSDESPQANEMMEYLADIVIEAFHETDDELRQTSALGVLQIVDSSNIELPARLMHLGLEAIRKNSPEVGYAGIVLVVKLLETDQELDLSQNDVSFIFDKLDDLAQHEAHNHITIIKPIYKLVSRFPREFISDKQISQFVKKCAQGISRDQSLFALGLEHKYIPRVASIWKERFTNLAELKEAFAAMRTIYPEEHWSHYIRTGYNAFGEKFHDEIIKFIKQAKQDPKLKMSDLYANCGDVFYNVFKHQRKDYEAKEVITTLLELFNLRVVSFEDQQMQDRAELENRYDKLKEVFKKETLGQSFTDFIDGLSHDEPVEKIQFEFERSHPIFNPRSKDESVFKAALTSLLNIAAELRTEADSLIFRTKILACCLGYAFQARMIKDRTIKKYKELYEDLLPYLSFSQRTFLASEALEVVSIKLDRNTSYSLFLTTIARCILRNPTARNIDFLTLIDCLVLAPAEKLPISLSNFVGLILFLRSKKLVGISTDYFNWNTWICNAFEKENETNKDIAARICAMLSSKMDPDEFQELLYQLFTTSGTTIGAIKNRCAALLETSSPEISNIFMRDFVVRSDHPLQ